MEPDQPNSTPTEHHAEAPLAQPVEPSRPALETPSIWPASEHQPVVGTPVPSKKAGKKHWLVPGIAVAVAVILLAGGYTFAFYLPGQPSNVFSQSLNNTAKGYDSLVSYTKTETGKHYKGRETSGTLKVTGSGFAGDGSFSTQTSGTNGTGTLNLNLEGEKLTANLRSITAQGQTVPDVYFQVNGAKSLLDKFGFSTLDNLDGQWLSVDHTIFEGASQGTLKLTATPTAAQLEDAMTKVSAVNKDYLLSTKSDEAVLINKKYLGKSQQDGHTVYGYTVGYNAAHAKAYIIALGTALDSSSLNDWVKQISGGKSASSLLDAQGINSTPSDDTFTMYVDAKTKLPRVLHFIDKSELSNYLDLGLNYTGGGAYPFTFKIRTKDGGTVTTADATFTLNTTTNQISGQATLNEDGDNPIKVVATLSSKPNNSTEQITAPTGAKSINDVLNGLGLGSNGGFNFSGDSLMLDSDLLTRLN